tara:strand:- start:86 stop:211 length:126 start_codon:yes stop_codon:yes gene_type:complete
MVVVVMVVTLEIAVARVVQKVVVLKKIIAVSTGEILSWEMT